MADNITFQTTVATPPSGVVVATDDVVGVQYQVVKLDVGGNGVSAPLGTSNPLPINDAGGSLTVDAPVGTPVFVRISNGTTQVDTLPVSLASLPALAAGTNNIGDIDVLTTPKASTVSAAAQTTQGTTAAQVLAANSARKQFMIQNTGTTVLKFRLDATDPTQTVYHFALSACASADDGTGGVYVSDLYTGVVKAISATSGGTMVITEIS